MNMDSLKKLEQAVKDIQDRNARVEADKAWETSFFRRTLVTLLTYFIIVFFFFMAGLSNPFVNAIVPTIGYLLSTLSIPAFKKLWLRYWYKG